MDKDIAKAQAAADTVKAYIKFLVTGVNDGRWTQPEILAQVGGKLTSENACGVARKRGFDQKASLN
jgi:hypothetical protein